MRALAIVPARGGSKGVPRKNLRECAGAPLFAWSVWHAQACVDVACVAVSSDDDEILGAAAELGAVPLRRPPELATDEALTDPVLVHAVRELADIQPDAVVLLQPTVPVREAGLVDRCLQRIEAGADSVLTAYPLHFVWWREQDVPAAAAPGPYPTWWRSQCQRRPRRQDMRDRELMYHEDGSVFAVRTEQLLATGQRVTGRVEIVETRWSPDIDTEEDFLAAAALLRALDGAA